MNIRALILATALAGTAVPALAQSRVQVFSETFSLAARGPYYVRLDSGVTYRLVREGPAGGDITVTPRSTFSAPVRFSASTLTGNGAPFVPATSGEYRIESTYQGSEVVQVRIFRESRDAPAARCVNPNGPDCAVIVNLDQDEERGHKRISPAIWVMLVMFPAFLYGVFRNGKSF